MNDARSTANPAHAKTEVAVQFMRRHWYSVGAVVAVGALIYLLYEWSMIGALQRLLLLNFIVLLLHQFEEYGWPGGFPAIMNMVLRQSAQPDRYPLNQTSAMAINVLAAYGFYLIPVFFPNVIWLGLAPVLFGMAQFVIHGIVTNRKLRSIYNPGLAAVVFGHIPIGILYIYYICTHNMVGIEDWVFTVLYMFAFQYLGLLKMTFTWLADRSSPYPFAANEMRRFNVPHRLERLKGKMPS